MKKPWEDIGDWEITIEKYVEIKDRWQSTEERPTIIDAGELGINAIDLYCLLKVAVSEHPLGPYTILLVDKPLGNLFYWDFLIVHEVGFIHVWRKQRTVEIMYEVDDESFDLKKFIGQNIARYKKGLVAQKALLEEHKLFINHFDSYTQITSFLWKQIQKLDLTVPEIYKDKKRHVTNKNYGEELERYIENSIAFHAQGKSLILNSAFLAEAALNMAIRLLADRNTYIFPNLLKRFLSFSFKEKVDNICYFTRGISINFSSQDQEVIDVLTVMTIRNKYVHNDESSNVNRVGSVFFDGDFPVFPNYEHSPLIRNIQLIYHKPDFELVEKCYLDTLKFVEYLFKHIHPELGPDFRFLIGTNPIGFNTKTKGYSAIYSPTIFDGVLVGGRAEEE